MSFSGEVKEELAKVLPNARHCHIAELTAIITMCGGVSISAGKHIRMNVQTENPAVARKCFTLLKKAYNIVADIKVSHAKGSSRGFWYTVQVGHHDDAVKVLQASKLLSANLEMREENTLVNRMVVAKDCCRRAFLRGAFLVSGSISDPLKGYHLEIVCGDEDKALQLQSLIRQFSLDARVVARKKHYMVYLKEGEQISDMLNLMGAHVALMEFENARILRDISNNVNRKVNCETANINRTVNAAVRQIEDIRFLQEKVGFEHLPEKLAEIASIRLEYPDASLQELGGLLKSPVGKSGVNHRLRKLSSLAEKYRS